MSATEDAAYFYRVSCPDCDWGSPVRHIFEVVANADARRHDREEHGGDSHSQIERLQPGRVMGDGRGSGP